MKFLILESDRMKTIINLKDLKSVYFLSMKEMGIPEYFYAELIHNSLGEECLAVDLRNGDLEKFMQFLNNDAKTLVLKQIYPECYLHTDQDPKRVPIAI